MRMKVEKFRPNKYQGSKEERIQAALEPRYENLEVWHYKGGYVSMLEEELLQSNPRHDDIKDALASAVSMETKRPRRPRDNQEDNVMELKTHPRFGGIMY